MKTFAFVAITLATALPLFAQRPLPLTVTDSTDGPIYAVAVWNEQVYIGGHFTSVDSIPANSIAIKEHSIWKPLGTGVHGTVLTLAIDSIGGVYVGGKFDSVGGIAANNVAHWDGTSWNSLAGGVNDTVYALLLDRDTVYCGGAFDTIEGRRQCAFARWKATDWDTTDNEVRSGTVRTIVGNSERKLVIAGSFVIASNPSAVAMTIDNLPVAKLRGGDNVPEIHSIVFHRHGVLANGPAIFSQLSGSAEESYSEYLANPSLHGIILGLHYYDEKRFIASGSFDLIGGVRDTFASFYDGAGWRAFAPRPPTVSTASQNVGRTLYLIGGDLSSGYLALSQYRDSIGINALAPAGLPTCSQFLDISVRADSISNDTLAVVLKNAAYGWPELDPSSKELEIAPGLLKIARFTIYVHPVYKGDAVLALFSNSSSLSDPVLHIKMESNGSVAALASLPPGAAYDATTHSLIFEPQVCGFNVNLFDISGRLVDRFAVESNSRTAPILDLPEGLYFYRAEMESGQRTGKILIY